MCCLVVWKKCIVNQIIKSKIKYYINILRENYKEELPKYKDVKKTNGSFYMSF